MFKIKSKILKKLSAGFMAGLCAFSMLGSSMSGVITANAASSSTENAAFPSADTVIAKAATLLGSPYTFGNKGYWYSYNQGQYTPLSVQTINNLGIDCSGLVYYTLTQLGYKTSGFSWNNPVPVDTAQWLTVNDNCTITYDGVTSKVEVEKSNIKTTDRPYWECSDGSTITPGSVVVAENPGGIDHAWIYMGEFDSRNDVVSYLKSIGVSESLINSKTVGNGTGAGGTHWRIESNGSEGVVINNKTDGKTATAMNMSAFRITKTDVTFEIDKYNTDGNLVGKSSVDNSTAVYRIYSDKSCTKKVGEITIGADGTGKIQLPDSTYYAKELKAPTGYSIDPTVYTIKAGKNKVTEDFKTGTIKINKTAEDGIISGREFKITYSYNGKSLSETAKTNANGIAAFDDLRVYDMSTGKAITYTVSEINVDTRYEVPKAQNVTLTSGDVDLTVNVKFNNQLKTGSIKINKQSEDNQNGDREFTITGNGKTYTIKTGSDGVAILSDIPVYNSNNEKIVYTISEKNVPVRYVVPADQTATLTADATTTKTFKNILKKFTVEVTKQDSETASEQGNGTLAGAVYGLYLDGELVDQYVTDENGYFKTKEYVCGNYTVQEISPSEGYLLDETVYSVGAESENYCIEHNSLSMTVTEDVIKGNIAMIKHSDDGSTQIETPEVGAEFEVYLKSSGSYANAVETERDHLTCDENGFAQTKDMSYGIYTVHQTVGWEGTEFIADFDVNISESGQTYRYLINNAKFESYIKIVKVDSETGKTIPYEGAGFEIYDSNGQKISMTFSYPTPIDTFYTNSEGYLITPEVLPYGEYSLVEVQAPVGYVLDSTPVSFTVSADNAEEENALTVIKVRKENTAQKGKISVRKTGDIFTSVATASSAYTNENGEMIVNPTTYTPVFADGDLSDAVFQVIAVEDIVTLDGTTRAYAGDVVSEITTDENGYAETEPLYLGKYEVRETKAPYGYVLNNKPKDVELTYAGQEFEVRDTVNTAFENEYQSVRISLSKVMENDELFGIYGKDYYTSIRFGLFAAEDITAADGSVIPADGLISEVSLDENMTAKFDTALPFGKYYVKEIATDEHYVLNGEKYLVNFEYMGQDIQTVSIDCGQFTNDLKRGKIEGIKVSESDEPLENALFGLFYTDCTEFTEENAIMTAKSDKQGKFEFTEIPYGEYIVCEIEAPTGYILSDESYPVTISEDGEIIEITAVNKPITIEISKQDIYGNELVGAKMQLDNSDGKVVEKWTSDGTNHVVTELPAGDYTLKEIAAPDGYVIATDIRFTVDVYGKITVENVDATAVSENGNPLIVMVDDTTKVKISKRDITTDKELAGATLQIIDEDGNVATEWVSTDEAHFIEGKLIAGKEYTLRETIAPDGYEIASEIKFTVNTDGSVTEVVMYDEHTPELEIPPTVTIDTPNTGVSADNSAEFYLVAAAVVVAFGMVICKRNDKEKRKDDVK